MLIRNGLIIAAPWIDDILDGRKTWDMRPDKTEMRGPFALIRAQTSTIEGVARLAGVVWALPRSQIFETFPLHRIPPEMVRSGEFDKINIPWVLRDVRRLVEPLPFEQARGALEWVDLPDEIVREVALQLDGAGRTHPLGPAVH